MSVGFDWLEYLQFARSLAVPQATEASKRIAISRAYYAAFHHARTFFQLQTNRLQDAHKVLQDRALDDPRHEVQVVGRKLKRLHELRKQADYETRAQGLDVAVALHDADEVIKKLDASRGKR